MAIGEIVEEVFHGFLTVLTEGAPRGAYEASLLEVVPSEDTVLGCELEKKGDLRPEKRLPDFAPNGIGDLVWRITL